MKTQQVSSEKSSEEHLTRAYHLRRYVYRLQKHIQMTSMGRVTVCLLVMISPIFMYEPEEIECPEQIESDFFFPSPWIPPGTPSRAELTLPPVFETQLSSIPGRGIGIISKTFVPRHKWLSEYEGEYVPIEAADDRTTYDYAWRVRRDGVDDRLIDGMDESLSNWLRYVNCARHVSEENVDMTMCYGHIFFKTVKDVIPGHELLMYCGDDYGQEYLNMTRNGYFDS